MSGAGIWRRFLPMILRIAISGVLIVWLMYQLQGGVSRMRAIDPISLIPAALVFGLSTVLGAWQWSLILRRSGLAIGHGRLQSVYWVGVFFNNFLPSNVGGDLVKVTDVAVSTGRVAQTLAGTLLDRLLGLSALVAVAFLGGALLGDRAPAGLPWWALAGVIVPVFVLSAVLLSGRLGRWLVFVWSKLRRGGGERLLNILTELQAYRSVPSFVLRLGLLALVVQSLRVATHVLVAQAMGIEMDAERIMQLYVLVPILGVAIVLPLSFNGLGVRELVATRLMPDIGISAEMALAFQLTTYFVQVAVSLIGGVIFVSMFVRGRLVLRPGARRPADSGDDGTEGR